MPIIRLPNQRGKWVVDTQTELSGDLQETFNVDINSQPGKLSLSRKIIPHTTNSDEADMGLITEFSFNSSYDGTNRYWAISSGPASDTDAGLVYYTPDLSTTKFAPDVLADSPTTLNDPDLETPFLDNLDYDTMFVSNTTDAEVYKLDNTGWNLTWGTGMFGAGQWTIGLPIVLKRYQDWLLIGNNNYLDTIDSQNEINGNLGTKHRVKFESTMQVAWIECTKDNIYIGLWNKHNWNSQSQIVEYNIFSETTNTLYIDEGNTIGFIHDDVCHILDARGNIKEYNGRTFEKVIGFPYSYTHGENLKKLNNIDLPHRNGIKVIDGRPTFNIGSAITSFEFTGIKSGLWVWDTVNKSLFHKQSASLDTISTNLDYGITLDKTPDGDPLYGALFSLNGYSEIGYNYSNGHFCSNVLAAKCLPVDNTNYVYGIFQYELDTSYNKRGYVITPKITSSSIDSMWKRILIKYDYTSNGPIYFPLPNGDHGIIGAKYRTDNNYNHLPPLYADIGWITDSTFQVSGSAFPNYMREGDEVFVTAGKGAGGSATIAKIVYNTIPDSYTITLDEYIVPSASGVFYYELTNWIQLNPYVVDDQVGWIQIDIPETAVSEWIQFKIELRSAFEGQSYQINEIQIGVQPNLILEK